MLGVGVGTVHFSGNGRSGPRFWLLIVTVTWNIMFVGRLFKGFGSLCFTHLGSRQHPPSPLRIHALPFAQVLVVLTFSRPTKGKHQWRSRQAASQLLVDSRTSHASWDYNHKW